MIIRTFDKHRKPIACFFFLLFYAQLILSNHAMARMQEMPVRSNYYKRISAGNPFYLNRIEQPDHFSRNNANNITARRQKTYIGGPTQPEMQAFQSVNANNMVDLFTGDFSYNIPLMDVGGYPVNLAYRGGISMDQEASWVGLGWNINPGTITRNLRGVPDDFDGADSIKKTSSIKENKTVGVTGGADVEVTGFPIGIGMSLGVFHNNYKGWGIENGINATINSGSDAKGPLTAG